MLVRGLAVLLLLLVLWTLFRYAMGMRAAKVTREAARRAREGGGGTVVAEIPLPDGLLFFVDEGPAFDWGRGRAAKADLRGGRLLLNGGVMGAFSRDGRPLPEPPPPEDFEGRERWDVILYLAGGEEAVVPCGTLREGVSREIAARVFAAVKGACP
ncbi:MAG TPA: hypothetical protein VII13_01150 [Vicinamibacteria bacterium]|jgi:hypothetical protein